MFELNLNAITYADTIERICEDIIKDDKAKIPGLEETFWFFPQDNGIILMEESLNKIGSVLLYKNEVMVISLYDELFHIFKHLKRLNLPVSYTLLQIKDEVVADYDKIFHRLNQIGYKFSPEFKKSVMTTLMIKGETIRKVPESSSFKDAFVSFDLVKNRVRFRRLQQIFDV